MFCFIVCLLFFFKATTHPHNFLFPCHLFKKKFLKKKNKKTLLSSHPTFTNPPSTSDYLLIEKKNKIKKTQKHGNERQINS